MNCPKISRMSKNESVQIYELNLRAVYVFRTIGKGRTTATSFFELMNLPSSKSMFLTHEKFLYSAVIVCVNSIKNAEAVQYNGSTDISIALDGSWQRRR